MEKDFRSSASSFFSILGDNYEMQDSLDDMNTWSIIEFSSSTNKSCNGNNRSNTNRQNEEKKKSSSSPFLEMITLNKNKLLGSIYNNVYQRFPTDPPIFHKGDIWALGTLYTLKPHQEGYKSTNQYLHANQFLSDVQRTFMWFTYRRDFPCLEEYNTTSDIGWGCMVRTGQMLLAKTLLTHCFDRDFLTSNSNLFAYTKYRSILRLFGDNSEVPFSIHNIILQSRLLRGRIDNSAVINGGEWFSPNKIAKTLEHVVNNIKPEGITMYVPSDGIIYIDRVLTKCLQSKDNSSTEAQTDKSSDDHSGTLDEHSGPFDDSLLLSFERNKIQMDTSFIQVAQSSEIFNTAFSKQPSSDDLQQNQVHTNSTEEKTNIQNNYEEEWQPLLIMITSRIGLDRMNPIYIDHIHNILRCKNCVGIIGGKPRESVYFIGYQDDQIIYLDPHFVQPYVPLQSEQLINTSPKDFMTYQCRVPMKIPIQDIDPSIAIGFFFSTRSDFDLFIQDQKMFASENTSIFTVENIEPDYVQSEEAEFKFINLNK